MHKTGHSTLVHWDNSGGWDGEEIGGRGSGWGTPGRFMSMHGKNHHNIVKQLASN